MREREADAGLSRTERQAVQVGILDADCGCVAPTEGRSFRTRLAKLSRAVTGQRGGLRLADAKLELVREFACRTRQHRPAEQLIPALMKHGYRTDQIGTLAALAA